MTSYSNNMDGVLPDAIGDLEDLGTFYVSSNPGLRGPLPPSMARWRKLTTLGVYGCSFRGGALPALDFAKISSGRYAQTLAGHAKAGYALLTAKVNGKLLKSSAKVQYLAIAEVPDNAVIACKTIADWKGKNLRISKTIV